MSEITQIQLSEESRQAVVSLANGDRHVFGLTGPADDATAEMIQDVKSGKLGLYLSFFEGGTEEEVSDSLAEADDWKVVYAA